MTEGASGWLWLIVDVVFVAALAAALAYGVIRAKRRTNNARAPEYDDRSN